MKIIKIYIMIILLRLNQTSVFIQREGVFYGQCSELCGVYHGFMPIAVEAVSLENYLSWLDSQS